MWTGTGRRTKINVEQGIETRRTRTIKRKYKRQVNTKDDERRKTEDKEKRMQRIS